MTPIEALANHLAAEARHRFEHLHSTEDYDEQQERFNQHIKGVLTVIKESLNSGDEEGG